MLAGLAAVSTVFYAARNAVFGVWRYIESLVIIRIEFLPSGIWGWQVYRWLKNNGRLVHANTRLFGTMDRRVTPECLVRERDWVRYYGEERGGVVPFLYRQLPFPSLWLLNGWKPVWVAVASDCAAPTNDNTGVSLVAITFRWLVNPEAVLTQILKDRTVWLEESQQYNRFAVRTVTGSAQQYSADYRHRDQAEDAAGAPTTHKADPRIPPNTRPAADIGPVGATPFEEAGEEPCNLRSSDLQRGLPLGSRLEDLWVSDEVMEAFREMGHWKTGRRWFAERGVPWKRGYGLVGPPGNGKTSAIRAMAAALGMPIYLYDLASLTNNELLMEWKRMLQHDAPCVAVLEDLDRVFTGDKPRPGVMLGYDCLLNILDGIVASDGGCVFVTSNKPECLDEALMKKMSDGSYVTRPGRIDKVVEFLPPPAEGRLRIAQRILLGIPQEAVDQAVEDGEGDSGAEFQFRCFKIAEQYFWSERT